MNAKQWSELSYEVSRGELRMEVYLTFLEHLGCAGAVVINFFGGLKPIAAALVSFVHNSIVFYFFVLDTQIVLLTSECVQMNDFNVFSYMDSTFMHMFDEKINHIRPLRAADFNDDEINVEAQDPHMM